MSLRDAIASNNFPVEPSPLYNDYTFRYIVRFIYADLLSITSFLNYLHDTSIKQWVESRGKKVSTNISNWREIWHPQKVEVWARIAEDITDSEAIKWFHGNYEENNSIKGSILTGKMSQIGRIWHRMYPHYIKTQDGNIKRKGEEFIEIFTIFPDNSDKTCDFLDFLATDSDFTLVWKEESK